VLELFIELERVPRDQITRAYKPQSLRLATLLGLGPEWWEMNHVNDKSRWCDPLVRSIREELLEAVAELKKAPVGRADEGTRRNSNKRVQDTPTGDASNAREAVVHNVAAPTRTD
jgi:hypothetical protein